MIKLVLLIAVLCIAIIAGPMTSESQGFVHIAAGNYIIETSLVSAVVITVIALAVLCLVLGLVKRFIHIPRGAARWLRLRSRQKALTLQDNAYLAYEEGDYAQTLNLLDKSGAIEDLPLHALFVGAKSAFNYGEYDKCRAYLDQAAAINEDAKAASKIVRAKLNLRINNSKAALEDLSALRPNQRNKLIYRLYLLCYQHENDVMKLAEISSELVKHKLITEDEAAAIETRSFDLRLGKAQNAAELQQLWKSLSKQIRKDPGAIGLYAKRLIQTGDISTARTMSMSVLKNGLDPEFLEAVSQWDACIPDVLKYITNKSDAISGGVNLPLLKAKANLELREGLLQEALDDYRAALEFSPTAEIYNKIGQVLARQQNYAEAADYFIKASSAKDSEPNLSRILTKKQ